MSVTELYHKKLFNIIVYIVEFIFYLVIHVGVVLLDSLII